MKTNNWRIPTKLRHYITKTSNWRISKKIRPNIVNLWHHFAKLRRKTFQIITNLTSLFGVCGLLLVIGLFISPTFFENYAFMASNEFLGTSAQLLATIFVITISFKLLEFQLLAQSYTPRLLREFTRDKLLLLFFIVYPISIVLNLLFLSFPEVFSPQDEIIISIYLTIFCIILLVRYIFHIANKLQPNRIISDIQHDIPEDLYNHITAMTPSRIVQKKDEPFIILEQLLIDTIEHNDFFSYLHALSSLFTVIKDLLVKVQKEKTLTTQRNAADAIFNYFRRIFEQIKHETFTHRKEEFLIYFCSYLLGMINRLRNIKLIRTLHNANDIFESIGYDAIEQKLKRVYKDYTRQLNLLVKKEFKIIKEKIPVYDGDIADDIALSGDEKTLNITKLIYFELALGRPRFVKKLCILASKKGLEDAIGHLNYIFYTMLNSLFNIQNPKQSFRFMLRTIVNEMKEAHFISVSYKINETTFTTSMLYNHLDALAKIINDVKSYTALGTWMTEEFFKMSLKSIKNGFFQEIITIGVNGRFIIAKHPEFVEIVMDTLGKCLGIIPISYSDEQKEIAKELVLTELRSFQHGETPKHKEISQTIHKYIEQAKSI